MKYIILIFSIFSLIVAQTQKYNPITDKWETIQNDTKLNYNIMEDKWEFGTDKSELEYNIMEDIWELTVPD